MSFPETIMRQVKKAYQQTSESEKFVSKFSNSVQQIIRSRSGTNNTTQQDVASDITFLCRIAKDNDFADRQLIKLVANYVEKSLDKDPTSRQDPTKNFTFMKSIRN